MFTQMKCWKATHFSKPPSKNIPYFSFSPAISYVTTKLTRLVFQSVSDDSSAALRPKFSNLAPLRRVKVT